MLKNKNWSANREGPRMEFEGVSLSFINYSVLMSSLMLIY